MGDLDFVTLAVPSTQQIIPHTGSNLISQWCWGFYFVYCTLQHPVSVPGISAMQEQGSATTTGPSRGESHHGKQVLAPACSCDIAKQLPVFASSAGLLAWPRCAGTFPQNGDWELPDVDKRDKILLSAVYRECSKLRRKCIEGRMKYFNQIHLPYRNAVVWEKLLCSGPSKFIFITNPGGAAQKTAVDAISSWEFHEENLHFKIS